MAMLVWWVSRFRHRSPPPDVAVVRIAESRSNPGAAAAPAAEDPETPASPLEIAPNRARPAAGTGEAYLDHTFRSFIVARQAELELTPGQLDHLVADLLELFEIHTEVIGRFVEEVSVKPDAVTVRVPPFPVEGKAVRDLLQQRVRADFPAKADRILAELGDFVDDSFRGFGIADQTITVKPTGERGMFEVTWDVRVPEGQTASRNPEDAPYAGSSGVMLFARDQIQSGEYRFLAPILARRFPASTARP